MPIEATIKYTRNLTAVSIYDELHDRYCKDSNEADINNHTVSTGDKLTFFADPYDQTSIGNVTIKGSEGNTLREMSIEDLKDKQNFDFP